jgi:predicted GIY-YIG superfamily endonuclease
MPGSNENATIYLIEDINDLRYVGSTSEKRFEDRLYTHRRDKKDGKNNCSSALLNLSYCNIIKLKEIKNTLEERNYWESHYINNVYPECVNIHRFQVRDIFKYRRDYYQKNKPKIIAAVMKYKKIPENRVRINAQRKKNRAIKAELKRLENI